ncbi:sulfotransferase [Psychroflexus halocasei]|uniref:Sulfotransferase family protein n=1 Tax=Psychroflexus halocasei TaxID=908615 RepID=A0A1H4C399_9FLAO|nr:sulfotransferase [Psychroflexus halocasei]SEA54763.1 Sulfotransferase family protein [Psychroflexus halocasei]
MKLPNFIIAGERRSGSTTLYEVLKQHSEIDMHPLSDMDFFIEKDLFSLQPIKNDQIIQWDNYAKIKDYKKLFPKTDKKTAQKDADLLWWKPAHKRLANYLPETKFIFVLRNPVKRAESQYWNEVRKGRELRSFEKAIKESKKHTSSNWHNLHLEYKERGCYINSLNHFFEYIPENGCHVVILEKLFKNWDEEMVKIANFLDIDKEEAKSLNPIHSNKENVLIINPKYQDKSIGKIISIYDRICNGIIRRLVKDKHLKNKLQNFFLRLGKVSKRKISPVNQKLLKQLKEFYKPYNRLLEEKLNISLKEWD